MQRSRNDDVNNDVDGKHLDSRTNWLLGSSQQGSLSLGVMVSDWLPASSVYFHHKLRHPQKEHTGGRRQEYSLFTRQDITFTPGALGHLDQSLGWRGWGALICRRRAVHVVWSKTKRKWWWFIQYHKVNRCLARYSPRATTTNRPTTGHWISLHGLA